jgi:chromatin segregation and condensation protein Rec8/ScpA/Scc1 (kleisin family)
VHVREMFGARVAYARRDRKEIIPVFSPTEEVALPMIARAMRTVLHELPRGEPTIPQAIVRKVVSLEETMEDLARRISRCINMSFSEFSGLGKAEKAEVVVSFLAVLELIKRGVISARQEAQYGDIHIETEAVGVPRY